MSELTNVFARNMRDLTTPNSVGVNPNTFDNAKVPIGNAPKDFENVEALTVKQIKDFTAAGRKEELDVVTLKITEEVIRAKEVEAALINDKANKATTLSGYGISDAYTQGAIDSKVTTLESKKANKVDVETSLSNLSTTANKYYSTLAAANADIAIIALNQSVMIGEAANSGLWEKKTEGATSLTKSPYDPVNTSKNYTNSFFTNYSTAELLTISGKYVLSDGSVAINASFSCSDFIPVVGGESYNVYSYLAGNSRHAWYDENKVLVSTFGADQTTLSLKTYTAPPSARYARFSAYTTARDVAYMQAKSYAIDKIKAIFQQHTPQLESSKINYADTTVKLALDSVISKQNSIIDNQNNILGQLDLASDKEEPYFVNTFQYTRSGLTPTNFNIVAVTARDSANVMTVSDSTAFVYGGACVVYDPTENSYTGHSVIGINGTTITVMPPLPANPTQAQTMHDSTLGQHLSLFGTKGLADYVLKSIQKYSYKKAENLVFRFNASLCAHLVWNDSDIYNGDATQLLIPVTKIGTAGNGGFTTGTTNLAKICAMSNPKESYQNIGTSAHTQYLSRAYHLIDSVAGNGFEISFNGNGSDGFIEIPLAVRDEPYISSSDSQTYRTSGKARLQVFNDSTLIHDAVYAAGQVHSIFVDFVRAGLIKVRITCETSVPTWAALSGIFAYKKSSKTSKDKLFKDGDVLVFLMDSWGIYPVASTVGETPYIYPISNLAPKYQAMYPKGLTSAGTHWISRRIQENLANQGVNVETYSYSYGGQTTRWGKYWLDAVLTMSPKPTHCVINFGINDNNSIGNPSNTFYDFDPEKMFANKAESSGGINGRTASFNEWELNLKWIAERCLANGVKPVIMMPSHTASAAQAQSIRQNELVRLADGFDI